jgi:ubiquinone/menaquinone biosynthesis C-methylase UbiE
MAINNMTDFDYEKSIWGKNMVGLSWADPASWRLRQSLKAFAQINSGKILEVGCGAGQFIRAIKNIKPKVKAHGSDISLEAIKSAKEISSDVIYQVSEKNNLPYPDNYFDGVVVFDVLEHVKNPEKILSEIRRVLRPEGIFYCFTPCEGGWTSLWNLLDKLNLKKELTKKFAGHINYFSRKSLNELYKKSGFKILQQNFSEHFIGQIIGVASFVLMNRLAKKKNITQMNNEMFFHELNQKTGMGIIKKIINWVINFESFIWQKIPSPNTHTVLRKQL